MALFRDPGRGGFTVLLLASLGLIAAQGLEELVGLGGHQLLQAMTTVLFLSAVYSVSGKKRRVIVTCLALAVPAIVATWTRPVFASPWIEVVGRTCGFALLAYIIALNVRFIFSRRDEVTPDLLAGAALVYLLLAVAWANLYALAELFHPGSFLIAAPDTKPDTRLFIYYSFVTVTSLGYGDVSPATPLTRSLAILEAVIGQLYLVMAVASLVGVRVSQGQRDRGGGCDRPPGERPAAHPRDGVPDPGDRETE